MSEWMPFGLGYDEPQDAPEVSAADEKIEVIYGARWMFEDAIGYPLKTTAAGEHEARRRGWRD